MFSIINKIFEYIIKILKYIIIIPFSLLIIFVLCPREHVYQDIKMYDAFYGNNGKIKEYYSWRNDIFPSTIYDEASVKKFILNELTGIDNLYVGYLIIEYSPFEYSKEIERLCSIKSDDVYSIYGLDGFNKQLCALNSNKFGLIYALSDDSLNEISYINIQFTDYVCDIDYTKIINKEDLPIGFNALPGNDVQKAFLNDELSFDN